MGYSNTNIINSGIPVNRNLSDNSASINNTTNNAVSNPISDASDAQPQPELLSKSCNQAVLAMGQAQLAKNNLPSYSTTPEQYISTLIKQGGIPNKNFTVKQSTRPDNRYGYLGISELNKDGKTTKETVFITDTPDQPKYDISFVKLYNTETDLPYKRIAYSDKKNGSYLIDELNSKTGEELSRTIYLPDGTIQETEDLQTKNNI